MKATLEVINRMQADGVIGKYAIGGAVGATFYLEPSATLDIDVFVKTGATNAGGRRARPARPTGRARSPQRAAVVGEGWPVQFLPPSDALGEEALAQAVETEVGGVRTWVMTAEHLVAIALKTGRAKDFARILQFVESGLLNADNLDAILRKHGLLEKWAEFGHKFLEGNK